MSLELSPGISSKSVSIGIINGVSLALRENLPIVVFVALYALAGAVVEFLLELPGIMQIEFHNYALDILVVIFTACFFAVQIVSRIFYLKRGKEGLLSIGRELGEAYFNGARVWGFFIVYISILPFLSTFTSFKEAIPKIRPFVWDEVFMKLDYYLHLRNHPWELLHPFLAQPLITRTIDVFYMMWFPILFTFIFFMGWSQNRVLRLRYFMTFGLVWALLGSLMAIVFSSAGPCYYSFVVNSTNPFVPLMDYIHSVHKDNPLWVVANQRNLWSAHLEARHFPFGGISAMPSLHLAGATLCALVGYQLKPWIGRILTIFCVVMLIGSVHLGWHYAIDGYVGVALTWLIWKATGKFFPH
jgi:PAP2 superfamily